MDLRGLIQETKQELTAWVDFKGFEVEVIYIDKAEFNAMFEKSKRRGFRKHQPVDEVDEAKLRKNIAGLIKGWRGLTLGKLKEVMNINPPKKDLDKEVECSDANKLALLEHLYGFENFITDTVTEIQEFRQEQQGDELGNSNAG